MLTALGFRGGWRAKKDRLFTERSEYDFSSMAFLKSSTRYSSQSAVDSDQSSAIGSSEVGSKNSYGSFGRKLNVQPSQHFYKKVSATHSVTASVTTGASEATNTLQVREVSHSLDQLAVGSITLAGREQELKQLKDLYMDPSVKMATVVGPSGLGKTALAMEMQSVVSLHGGVLCKGKFDVQNRADPYQAFVEVIHSFVSQNLSNKEGSKRLAALLNETIGEDMDILVELAPSIEKLLLLDKDYRMTKRKGLITDDDSDEASGLEGDDFKEKPGKNMFENAARIQNVLVEFCRLVSSEDCPMTILLDDIQWAGSASLGLIEALLENDDLQKKFFLLATCRDAYLENGDEIDNTETPQDGVALAKAEEPYPQLIDLLDRYSHVSKRIILRPLDSPSVQVLVNTLLRMDDSEETTALAKIIQQKTGGNPFFVLQFMNVLVQQELLLYNTNSYQWTWLEGEIQLQNVADNVAQAVYKRLQLIEPQDLFFLQIVSTIGNTFEVDMAIFVIEGLFESFHHDWVDTVWPTNLEETLERLMAMGIIQAQYGHGKYDFAHDQIQSTAFRMIPEDRRQAMQLAIGQRLVEGLDSWNRDQYLFPAVQLCISGMALMNKVDREGFAFWAFAAGDMATKQGAFESALHFFQAAVKALGEEPFLKDEELALPLFCAAAESALAVGSDAVHGYLDTIDKQTQIPKVKRARAYVVRCRVLLLQLKYQEVAEILCGLMKSQLGVMLSPKPNLLGALLAVRKTAKLVGKCCRQDFLDLPLTKDEEFAFVMDIVWAINAALYMANPALWIMTHCKMVMLSLKYGLSQSSPISFLNFSVLLKTILNQTDKSIELGEAAIAIIEKHHFKEVVPNTTMVAFGFVFHWKRPMQQYMAPFRYAIDVALRRGKMEDAMNLYGLFAGMVNAASTTPLKNVLPEMDTYLKAIKHSKRSEHLNHARCSVQFAHKLHKPDGNNTVLTGEIMNEEEMIKSAGDKFIDLSFLYNYKIQLLVYLGKPVEAADLSPKVLDMGFKYGQGTCFVPRLAFFIGLANLQAYGQTKKNRYLRIAKMTKNRIKVWLKEGNPNVPHYLPMLKAEKIRVMNRKKEFKSALDHLNEAGVLSCRMGSSLDYALAAELRSLFLYDQQLGMYDLDQASYYMKEALRAYHEYGAGAKVQYLRETYPDLVGGTE